MAGCKIGIDLGGTNFRVAIVDDEHELVTHRKESVGEPRDPETIVERCARVVEELAAGNGGSVGVGIAAMLHGRQGDIAVSPHLRWRDVPFGSMLAKRLGDRFVVGIYNDVNAIVYGEGVAGAGRGSRDLLGVFVGTGIGGGLIVNGQLVEGATNTAGEIGHCKVRWDDDAAPCACGNRGCVEAYCGGTYVQARIQKELAAGAKSKALELAGGIIEDVHPGHIDQAAAEGDDYALALWSELAPLLAVTLGNAIAVLNPDRLVLGGGFLGRAPTLLALVETALEIVGNRPSQQAVTVVTAGLGDDAGLVGSSALAAAGVSVLSR
jgi:glucokinase